MGYLSISGVLEIAYGQCTAANRLAKMVNIPKVHD